MNQTNGLPAMNSNAFFRYDLRTTDADAARAFYSEVVGLDFRGSPPGEPSLLAVWPLHERALARGAPPHWLGHIDVSDVEAAASHLAAGGGERLGPTVQASDGASYATVRDPSGSLVSVRASAPTPHRAHVAWHQLHTTDVEGAWALYSGLFGWKHIDTLAVADPPGGHRIFAWRESDSAVGSMANTARWPGVHSHWLFYFPVIDIEGTLLKVVANGGVAIAEPALLPNGDRFAPCEDAQGAAFGVYQSFMPSGAVLPR
jgi:predicted enzyme related to lactoylglutathione lyase